MQDLETSTDMDTPFGGVNTSKLDFSIIEATMESFTTGSLTPIIKEELKWKIQASRLAAGKAELPKPVFKQPEKLQLTPEEEEKRKRRREKNRIAALKCRNKKKQSKQGFDKVQEELEHINKDLKQRVEHLEREKHQLLGHLNDRYTDSFLQEVLAMSVQEYSQMPASKPCTPETTCTSTSPTPSCSSVIEDFNQPELLPKEQSDYFGLWGNEMVKAVDHGSACAPPPNYEQSCHMFLPVPVEEEAMVPGSSNGDADTAMLGTTSPSLFGEFW